MPINTPLEYPQTNNPALSILIADDEIAFTDMMLIMLKSVGHKVVATVRNGPDAIRMAEFCEPDLILMDIGMPGMDGITAAEKILAKKSVPIIILTGTALDETMDRIGQMEIQSCLIKPFSKEQLRSAIRLAMIRHQSSKTQKPAELPEDIQLIKGVIKR